MKYMLFAFFLLTVSSALARDRDPSALAGDEKVKGLICDQETPDGREGKTKIEISVKGDTATLQFRDAFSISGFGLMRVDARGVEPILANELAKMNKQTLVDRRNGSEIVFRIDGYTYDQKPRLGAKVKLKNEELKLTSCLAEIDRPYRPY